MQVYEFILYLTQIRKKFSKTENKQRKKVISQQIKLLTSGMCCHIISHLEQDLKINHEKELNEFEHISKTAEESTSLEPRSGSVAMESGLRSHMMCNSQPQDIDPKKLTFKYIEIPVKKKKKKVNMQSYV